MDLTASHIHPRVTTPLNRTARQISNMKVNRAILCIVLMACGAMCAPPRILKCRCIKVATAVKLVLIADVNVYKPLPYCNKTEVIVLLKNGNERCLDPELDSTKRLLEIVQRQKERSALVLTSTTSTTTTSSSSSNSTPLTSSSSSSNSTPLQTNTPTS